MSPFFFCEKSQLQLGDGDTDSSDDVNGGRFVSAEAEKLDGVVEGMRPEDETISVVTHVAKGERVGYVHGVDVGPRRLAGHERVIVPIEDDNGAGGEDGFHGASLRGGKADRNESLPVATSEGAARAKLIEHAGRKMDALKCGALIDDGGVKSGGRRNERHDGKVRCGMSFHWRSLGQQVFNTERLGGEDSIEGGETEHSFAVNEVRKMRRAQTSLPREQRAGKLPALDAAGYFHAKPLVELREIHLWNVVCELYTPIKQFADCKAT